MSTKRVLQHLATPSVRRAFDAATLDAIEQTIAEMERSHGGEIRFAIEASLPPMAVIRKVTPRERALEVFAHLHVWDTEANNGVLIYVLWADHDVEIVADRGYNGRVSARDWSEVCHRMEQLFGNGDTRQASTEGVRAVGALIARHFPSVDRNELPNRPVVL